MTDVLTEEELHKRSPQELTTLLYQGCIKKLEQAIISINEEDYSSANQSLQRCNDILYRLGAGINYEAGIIADQLEAVYNYMAEKLIEANVKKDVNPVKEVLTLLKEIYGSWQAAYEKIGDLSPSVAMVPSRTALYEKVYEDAQIDVKE